VGVYTDSADLSERSKSHSTNDKLIQNEVNTPHYSVQKVYRSVGPGLVEVWAEVTRQHPFASPFVSIPKTVVYSLLMSSLLYMGMHHYSLVRYLNSHYSIKCPIYDYHVKGKTSDILIAFERLTHAGLLPPFVGSGTDISADTRADIGGPTQICTDLEVIPSFLEIRSRSSVDG
jgi:hypothetical protein